MIEEIRIDDKLVALVIKSEYHADGIKFFTPDEFSQQLAYMNRPQGYVIPPHVHNPVKREIYFTKEVLFVKTGKVRVDFYDEDQIYIRSYVINTGDIILLAYGGHGFTMLEDTEMIEVKQGPYAGDQDKTRFQAISPEFIKFK